MNFLYIKLKKKTGDNMLYVLIAASDEFNTTIH